MTELKTEYLPVESLTPYERNARKHGETDLSAIKASIEQFGFLDPIGVWGPKNIIVEGHGRLMAAKELGLTEVPCIRLDNLTDKQRRAYALAHNKTAELSWWDFDKLDLELKELSADGDLNLHDFGFFFTDEEAGFGGSSSSSGVGGTNGGAGGGGSTAGDLTKEELDQYADNADKFLEKRRVIITFDPEREGDIRELLGIEEESLRVVYDISELRK